MEKIKKLKHKSIKKSFFYAMLCTVAVIILFSAATIFSCLFLQKMILPDSDYVYLTVTTVYEDGTEEVFQQRMRFGSVEALGKIMAEDEEKLIPVKQGVTHYSVNKIESSFESLSPKRKAAYSALSSAMVILPTIYAVVGVLLCVLWFYRKKLEEPIRILSNATNNIANENLDFTIHYNSGDEMGALCGSFEAMRQALYNNNRTLWSMLEERRMLQSSVAHDLRNPIAIIEGYTEYLQENIQADKLSKEKLLHTVSNLWTAAKRLENYTDSVQEIHHLEELELHYTPCLLPDDLLKITEDFTVMAKQKQLKAVFDVSVPSVKRQADQQVLYRILENLFANALRFAKHNILVSFSLDGSELVVKIQDDGDGYPEEVLQSKGRFLLSGDTAGRHMGMGLVISRVLCQKHGGVLKLSNLPQGGAAAEARVLLL